MEFDALNQKSRTRRCEQDCVHLSLAWRPGETPSREEMEQAARDALKALGMENAKAIFVAHNDEDYAHIHIVASKINPATGRAYDLERSKIKLSDWALDYEREHGGVVSVRRARCQRAARRDPRTRRRRRARGADQAAVDFHADPAASRPRKRNHPARPARRRPRDGRTIARAV